MEVVRGAAGGGASIEQLPSGSCTDMASRYKGKGLSINEKFTHSYFSDKNTRNWGEIERSECEESSYYEDDCYPFAVV